MATCVQSAILSTTGGDTVLALAVMDPQPADLSTCTAVLLSGPEAVQAVNPILQPLTMSEGAQIAIAVLSLWAVAFLFRAFARGFFTSTSEEI